MKRTCTTLLTVAILSGAASMSAAEQSRTLIVDAKRPPATFEALVNATDIIVHARVVKEGRPRLITSKGGTSYVVRDQTIRIESVLKGLVGPARSLTVSQTGGMVVDGGGTVHDTSYSARVLKEGEELILFLAPWKEQNAVVLAFGESSVFRVGTSSYVSVPAAIQRYEVFGSQASIPLSHLLNLIQAVVDVSK